MDPAWIIVALTSLQFIGLGINFIFVNFADLSPLGDDTAKYENGELYWWEVRDIDRILLKRIKECNKAVASKNMPFIQSVLCLIQSWKLKVKIDVINLLKDTFAFTAAHKEFCLLLICVAVLICLARKSIQRWQKGEQTFDETCSYKSPHLFRKTRDNDTIFSDKVNIGDVLEDWSKLKKNKAPQKTKEPDEKL